MAYTYTLSDDTVVKSYHSEDSFMDRFNQLDSIFDFMNLNDYTAFSDEFTHE